MSQCSREVTIANEMGLHVRPANRIAEEASRFVSDIRLCKDGQEVDAKSIFEILTLAAGKGTVLTVRAEGSDAEDAVSVLAELVGQRFGEV